jgi:hypothetical protein
MGRCCPRYLKMQNKALRDNITTHAAKQADYVCAIKSKILKVMPFDGIGASALR